MGHIRIHSRKDQRFLGSACHKTYHATQGTALSRRRTAATTVSLVVTLLAYGCPGQALVAALRLDERTVAAWGARAGQQGQVVQESGVEPPHDWAHGPADEIRVKRQGGLVWMALAMMVRTRWWRAGEVSAPRDRPLMRRRMARVCRGAAHRPLLFCTDGVCSSMRASRATWRDPV